MKLGLNEQELSHLDALSRDLEERLPEEQMKAVKGGYEGPCGGVCMATCARPCQSLCYGACHLSGHRVPMSQPIDYP